MITMRFVDGIAAAPKTICHQHFIGFGGLHLRINRHGDALHPIR
ncbi:Uncharacterised protein [Vibrio cholerae]|nr:Uncharacterised protein [Vibrio cholerae]